MPETVVDETPEDREKRLAAEKKDDSAWERVQRVDLQSGEVGERRRTQQGGLVARANLTRTGVLTYHQPDGTVRRELRHPDEVFDKDSLQSLAHATLTIDHPEKVTPENWRRVATGHVAGTPHRAGKFVQSELHIQDADAIKKAELGKLQELSCGYECSLDPTPGEYEGEKYDAIQRKIRYNHVAAGPAGWGRAGPDVRLHLDGGAGVSGGEAPSARDSTSYVRSMPETDDKLAALQRQFDELKTRTDKLETENGTLKGENVALKTRTDTEDRQKREALERARADASFDAHLDAIDDARTFLGRKWERKDASGALKTVEVIQREVLAHLRPKMKLDGMDANEIKGAYRIVVADEGERRVTRGLDDLSDAAFPGMNDLAGGGGGRTDARPNPFAKGPDDDDDDDGETKKAQDAMFARQKDKWRMPKRDRRHGRETQLAIRQTFGGNSGTQNSGGYGAGMGS